MRAERGGFLPSGVPWSAHRGLLLGGDRTLKFSEDRDSLDKALALRYTDPVQQSRPENGICIEKVHIRGTASSIPGSEVRRQWGLAA